MYVYVHNDFKLGLLFCSGVVENSQWCCPLWCLWSCQPNGWPAGTAFDFGPIFCSCKAASRRFCPWCCKRKRMPYSCLRPSSVWSYSENQILFRNADCVPQYLSLWVVWAVVKRVYYVYSLTLKDISFSIPLLVVFHISIYLVDCI